MACKWGLLATYKSWDDPPSNPSLGILQVHRVGDGFQASPAMAQGMLAFLDCGGKLDVSLTSIGWGDCWWAGR